MYNFKKWSVIKTFEIAQQKLYIEILWSHIFATILSQVTGLLYQKYPLFKEK